MNTRFGALLLLATVALGGCDNSNPLAKPRYTAISAGDRVYRLDKITGEISRVENGGIYRLPENTVAAMPSKILRYNGTVGDGGVLPLSASAKAIGDRFIVRGTIAVPIQDIGKNSFGLVSVNVLDEDGFPLNEKAWVSFAELTAIVDNEGRTTSWTFHLPIPMPAAFSANAAWLDFGWGQALDSAVSGFLSTKEGKEWLKGKATAK